MLFSKDRSYTLSTLTIHITMSLDLPSTTIKLRYLDCFVDKIEVFLTFICDLYNCSDSLCVRIHHNSHIFLVQHMQRTTRFSGFAVNCKITSLPYSQEVFLSSWENYGYGWLLDPLALISIPILSITSLPILNF